MAYPFAELIDRLERFYQTEVPVLTRIAAEHKSPFLVLIGCLLSLRTKDETTEKAMERLMEKARTPEELLAIPTEDREDYLSCRFLPQQIAPYQGSYEIIIEKYHRTVPDTIEELTTIRGIGRKTANIVVTEGFGKAGVAVDTHVHRISNRLGAVATKTPDRTEEALRKSLPRKYWNIYNPLLVTHGRKTCTPLFHPAADVLSSTCAPGRGWPGRAEEELSGKQTIFKCLCRASNSFLPLQFSIYLLTFLPE